MNDGRNGYWITHKNACEFYGVSKNTLRSWADNDKVVYKRIPSNQRVYFISSNIDQPKGVQPELKQNVVYCRVSSSKQKDDLDSSRYPNHKII